MTMDSGSKGSGGRSALAVMLALALIAVIVVAIIAGRAGGIGSKKNGSPLGGGTTTVRAVVGSEKMPFFEDQRVRDRLESLGYKVDVTASGSRKIATRTDLKDFDLAFPSSSPAAEKIASATSPTGTYTPFHSPMAIATFTPVIEALKKEGIASERDGTNYIDAEKFLEFSKQNKRWRDISSDYRSPLTVQISTTDIRSSNSAAMYLAILSWVANGGNVPTTDAEVQKVVQEVSPLFTHQGYTGSSSAGPFSEYLSQGMGSKPMVMVYEAQFIGQKMSYPQSIAKDMVLAYIDPTVLSQHTVLAYSDNGKEIGRLLSEDKELQKLAAEHGFRPQDPAIFEEVLSSKGIQAPPRMLGTINPPDYNRLEQLIEGVSAQYNDPVVPEGAPEQ